MEVEEEFVKILPPQVCLYKCCYLGIILILPSIGSPHCVEIQRIQVLSWGSGRVHRSGCIQDTFGLARGPVALSFGLFQETCSEGDCATRKGVCILFKPFESLSTYLLMNIIIHSSDEKIIKMILESVPKVQKRLIHSCIRYRRVPVLERIFPILRKEHGVEIVADFFHGCR